MITAPLATSFLLLAVQAAAPAPPATPPAAAPAPSPPSGWPFNRFSGDDYPAGALRGEEQGNVYYRIEIGADGRVTNCTITRSSGSAALDSATCRIVRSRARFDPARDSDGNAIADFADNGAVSWRLPRGERAKRGPRDPTGN